MQKKLPQLGSLVEFCEDLQALEVARWRATCKTAAASLEQFAGAICFALSRLDLRHDIYSITVKVWQQIWEDCARSVVRNDIDPSLWAFAHNFENLDTKQLPIQKGMISSFLEECLSILPQYFYEEEQEKEEEGDDDVDDNNDSNSDGEAADESEGTSASKTVTAVLCINWRNEGNEVGDRHALDIEACVITSDAKWPYAYVTAYILFDWDVGEEDNFTNVQLSGASYAGSSIDSVFALASGITDEPQGWKSLPSPAKKLMPIPGYDVKFEPVSLDVEHVCDETRWRDAVTTSGDLGRQLKCYWEELSRHSLQGPDRTTEIPAALAKRSNDFQAADDLGATKENEAIQDIDHDEPAARIDPEVALSQVRMEEDERWAESVGRAVGRMMNEQQTSELASRDETEEDTFDEQGLNQKDELLLLTFKKHPEIVRDALLDDASLRACAEGLREQNKDCKLPSGALIFVEPTQYRQATQLIEANVNHALKGHHVVVARSWEDYVSEALFKIPSRHRPSHKYETVGQLDPPWEWVESRTFLGLMPRKLTSSEVSQSTSEAHGAVNPRRHVMPHRL